MQGVCTEVAGILEEVAEHEEEEESPELPAPASAPARFSAAVKSAMVAARAAGLNPGAAQGRWATVIPLNVPFGVANASSADHDSQPAGLLKDFGGSAYHELHQPQVEAAYKRAHIV